MNFNKNIFKKQHSDFFDITFIYLLMMMCFVVIRILSSTGALGFLGDSIDYVFVFLIQIVVMLFLPIFLYSKFKKKTIGQVLKDFRFNKISLKAVVIAILLGVMVFIVNIAVSSFFALIISLFGFESLSSGSGITDFSVMAFVLTLITTALLPGICEEVANRGMLLKGFNQLGVTKAIFFSGLLFGLMHLNIEQFFYATIIGWFLAFICIATNNIIPGMIIHFMNNALSTYISFASHNGWFMGDFLTQIQNYTLGGNFFLTMFTLFLIMVTALFLLIWLTYLLFKSTTMKKVENLAQDLKQTMSQGNVLKLETLRIDIPFDTFGISLKQKYYPTRKESVFLTAILVLGIGITLSTLIWGTL